MKIAGAVTFALLLILSMILNVILFVGLSGILLIQIVLGFIGIGLDLTKAISLLHHRGKAKIQFPITSLFMLVSVIASTVALSSGIAVSTQELHRDTRSVEILDRQISSYADQLHTLTMRLDELPYDWPRNREMVLNQITEAQNTLNELSERRTELATSVEIVSSPDRTGRFIYDLSSIMNTSPSAVGIIFALIIAILIEVGIAFTASQITQDRSETVQTIPTPTKIQNKVKNEIDDENLYVKYVREAFPEKADSPLKGLEAVAEDSGLSMYWIRTIHNRLKAEGLITVNGRRSISTVNKEKALEIVMSIAA